jgi:uncharacterized protein (DUF433 family)
MKILPIENIVSDANIRGGLPIIKGTGLRVADVVGHHLFGDRLTPDEIANNFAVSLADVYAALAYYYLHQQEIDAWFAEDSHIADELLEEARQQGTMGDVKTKGLS